MPIRWKAYAIGLLALVAVERGDLAAQSTSAPTMTLVVDETQAFDGLLLCMSRFASNQDPLHSRIRAGFRANTDQLVR